LHDPRSKWERGKRHFFVSILDWLVDGYSKLVNDWNFERLAIMETDDDWIKFCVTIYPLLKSGLDYRNFLYRERKRKILFERKLAVEE
jgi:hypothetical protein